MTGSEVQQTIPTLHTMTHCLPPCRICPWSPRHQISDGSSGCRKVPVSSLIFCEPWGKLYSLPLCATALSWNKLTCVQISHRSLTRRGWRTPPQHRPLAASATFIQVQAVRRPAPADPAATTSHRAQR